MNHAKQIILKAETKVDGALLKLSRKQMRIYVMFLTGHEIFKAHLHKMKMIPEKLCRLCNDRDKTVEHLLGFIQKYKCVKNNFKKEHKTIFRKSAKVTSECFLF